MESRIYKICIAICIFCVLSVIPFVPISRGQTTPASLPHDEQSKFRAATQQREANPVVEIDKNAVSLDPKIFLERMRKIDEIMSSGFRAEGFVSNPSPPTGLVPGSRMKYVFTLMKGEGAIEEQFVSAIPGSETKSPRFTVTPSRQQLVPRILLRRFNLFGLQSTNWHLAISSSEITENGYPNLNGKTISNMTTEGGPDTYPRFRFLASLGLGFTKCINAIQKAEVNQNGTTTVIATGHLIADSNPGRWELKLDSNQNNLVREAKIFLRGDKERCTVQTYGEFTLGDYSFPQSAKITEIFSTYNNEYAFWHNKISADFDREVYESVQSEVKNFRPTR